MKKFFSDLGTIIVQGIKDNFDIFLGGLFFFGLGAMARETYLDHEAMKHGYDREVKIGQFESSCHKDNHRIED